MENIEEYNVGIETFRGIGHQWFCDVLGHVNSRYTLGMFDDATMQMLVLAKMIPGEVGHHWVDVRNEVDYRREIWGGALLIVRSTIVAIGSSSVTFHHRMYDVTDGPLVAEMRAKMVRINLEERRSAPLTPKLRLMIEKTGLVETTTAEG